MRWCVAMLVAVCVSVICASLAGWLGSGLDAHGALASLLLGLSVGALAVVTTKGLPPLERPKGWIEWSLLTFYAVFCLRVFCWVAFYRGEDIYHLTPNNAGDLALHVTFIEYFANGAPFWPDNPIYPGTGLQYPFGVDLWNALLLLLGVDLVRGLVWTGLVASVLTGVALWRWGGAFVVAGFLFNGGLALWRVVETGALYDFQNEVPWKSIPMAMFITQRGFLYALPVGLFLLWSWRNRFLLSRPGLPGWVEWLLYATLPLFHLHTFLALSFFLGFWFLVAGWWAPGETRWGVLRLGVAAFFPATLVVWLMTHGFSSASMISLKPGWMQEETPFFFFWGENFGILPLLVVALLTSLVIGGTGRGTPEAVARKALVIPALLLFLLCCYVMFAAWEWDNTKIMIWSYLALLPVLWEMMRRWEWKLRWLCVVLLFLSGFLSVLGGMYGEGYRLASRPELDALRLPLARLPVTSVYACVPTYNHPVLLLGHKAVMGYPGHLISHGYEIARRQEALENVLRAGPGWQASAREIGADYLFWGKREQEAYGDWLPAKERRPVFSTPWGSVYALGKGGGDASGLNDAPSEAAQGSQSL